MLNPTFSLTPDKKMLFSAWVRESCPDATVPCNKTNYNNSRASIRFRDGSNQVINLSSPIQITAIGSIIEGWQKVEGQFIVPNNAKTMSLSLSSLGDSPIYWDDIRIHPFNANMKSYVYDPINLRLTAELDANNYASFYEYDDEGTLIRTKVETKEGIKTIKETRSAKQKNITGF